MAENRNAVEELSLVARRKLREDRKNSADLIDSLGWLNSKKEEENQRAKDFEFVNQRLNELMQNSDNRPSHYRDITFLAQELKGKKIPTLEEARENFYASSEAAEVVTSTIERAVRDYPSWAIINPKYPSKGTPASGALIEGFGSFIGASTLGVKGNSDEMSQIKRLFVLAFEAVLISEMPNSPLVGDVIGWMKEEVETFPNELQSKINEIPQGS